MSLFSARHPIFGRPIPDRIPITALLMQIEIRAISDWIMIISENKQRSHIGMAHESFAQGFDTMIGMHAIGHIAGTIENRRNGD